MDASEKRYMISNKIRKFLTLLLVGYFALGIVINVVKLPVSAAGLIFKIEPPAYLPIEAEQTYAKVINLNRVQLIYENKNESIVVWATSKLGWTNIAGWDETLSLPDGTPAYYRVGPDDIQMFSWTKDKVEYSIDYKGPRDLSKEEFIKTALSMK
ncbi:hypothetical protein [Bacillus sp. FJAT-27245]|uniref:hypothetical protein n=1 Tax=Bacillus sp. FJAT-27245 TaxID=1684144 RepID=UPI0006A7A0EA|nr:hypothetical protein [Bacillus sp. FJAT-27245]